VVAPKAPEKPINILCIGDSLTGGGHWINEVKRRISEEEGASTAACSRGETAS
jgi:hypothetical protein